MPISSHVFAASTHAKVLCMHVLLNCNGGSQCLKILTMQKTAASGFLLNHLVGPRWRNKLGQASNQHVTLLVGLLMMAAIHTRGVKFGRESDVIKGRTEEKLECCHEQDLVCLIVPASLSHRLTDVLIFWLGSF